MLLRSHTAEASSDGKEEMPQTYREKSTFLSSRVVRRANFMLWQKRMVLHDSQKTFSSLTMRDCEGEKQQEKTLKSLSNERFGLAIPLLTSKLFSALSHPWSSPIHIPHTQLHPFYLLFWIIRACRSLVRIMMLRLGAFCRVWKLYWKHSWMSLAFGMRIFRMFSALYCHATRTHSSSSHTKRTLVRREREILYNLNKHT